MSFLNLRPKKLDSLSEVVGRREKNHDTLPHSTKYSSHAPNFITFDLPYSKSILSIIIAKIYSSNNTKKTHLTTMRCGIAMLETSPSAVKPHT